MKVRPPCSLCRAATNQLLQPTSAPRQGELTPFTAVCYGRLATTRLRNQIKNPLSSPVHHTRPRARGTGHHILTNHTGARSSIGWSHCTIALHRPSVLPAHSTRRRPSNSLYIPRYPEVPRGSPLILRSGTEITLDASRILPTDSTRTTPVNRPDRPALVHAIGWMVMPRRRTNTRRPPCTSTRGTQTSGETCNLPQWTGPGPGCPLGGCQC